MEKGKLMGFKPTRRAAALVAAGLVSTLALAACASTDEPAAGATGSGGGKQVTLSLVAYSTPQAAYEKIIAAFQKTDAGKNVKFTQSYGASGDQSRAVAAGLPADFVEFSLETDMTRLVDRRIAELSAELHASVELVDMNEANVSRELERVHDQVARLVAREHAVRNLRRDQRMVSHSSARRGVRLRAIEFAAHRLLLRQHYWLGHLQPSSRLQG